MTADPCKLMTTVREILDEQRAFFRTGATRPLEFRVEQLRRLQDAIKAGENFLLQALAKDLGRPAPEAVVSEIAMVAAEIEYAAAKLHRWVRPQRRRVPLLAFPASGWIQPEPLGVVLILGPWNYPVQLLLLPLVGAIAAGNCAVLKPSELAPETSRALARLIRDTFSPAHVRLLEGGPDLAEALVNEPFDKIFFTGSRSTGRRVMLAAAHHLTPVVLELGGKSPCIVCKDASLEVAARRIAWGKFLNAGQTCVAPDFVLVEEPVRDALIEALTRAIREFFGDDPRRSADYGRIVNRAHFERLRSLLSGGRVILGGDMDAESLYFGPTLITDVSPDAPLMQEEIFGPLLPILSFRHLDDALEWLAQQPAPLALYLFTRQCAIQERVLSRTRSGGVCINDTILQVAARELPFGGLGPSGMGVYHGYASFQTFSHYRPVLRRSFFPDWRWRYPPSRLALSRLKCLARWLVRW